MKTIKTFGAFFASGVLGWGLTTSNSTGQTARATGEDKRIQIAPQSLQDSCAEAERKFRIYLARFSPKKLRDAGFWRKNELRIESSWFGSLGADSAEYAVIYYRCFESSYLAIFRKNQKAQEDFLWQSPDFGLGVKFARLGEPEDLNRDGAKEIFFYHPERNAMDTTLELYAWNGRAAFPLARITGNFIEVKDLNGDGVKEIIANHNRIIWSQAGDTLVTDTDFFRWDGRSYTRYDSKRISIPIKD